jgi:hypothetical protein
VSSSLSPRRAAPSPSARTAAPNARSAHPMSNAIVERNPTPKRSASICARLKPKLLLSLPPPSQAYPCHPLRLPRNTTRLNYTLSLKNLRHPMNTVVAVPTAEDASARASRTRPLKTPRTTRSLSTCRPRRTPSKKHRPYPRSR